jgi:hypothetical protein
MNEFICFFNRDEYRCSAESLYAAKLKAIAHFKPRKSMQHMISVVPAGRPLEAALFS